MKKRTKNRGLRLAVRLIAVCLFICFSVGNVFAGSFVNSSRGDTLTNVKLTAYEAVDFVVWERPATTATTIIWAASILPGHRSEVKPRCNSPTLINVL